MIATGQLALPKADGGLVAELFRLADRARLSRDPELATARMKLVLALAGL